jgi:DNA-binding NarL/FixJ family response regulator
MQLGPASPIGSSSSSGITVVLVDRDRLARHAIRTRLGAEDDIEIAGEARDASEAVDLIRTRWPDIVLIASEQPDRAAGEAIGEILRASPATRIIVLALEADEDAQMRALRAGAAGWLVKPINLRALPRILRGVRAGEAGVTRAFGTHLLEEVIGTGGAGPYGLRPVRSPLTQREWEVADLLVQGATTAEIASQLGVTAATIRTHIKHILGKLGVHSRDEAIRYVERLRQLPGRNPSTASDAST